MGDKGEGGVKNLKNWETSFMDGPLLMHEIELYNDMISQKTVMKILVSLNKKSLRMYSNTNISL